MKSLTAAGENKSLTVVGDRKSLATLGINKNFDNFCRNVRILHDSPGDRDPSSLLEKPAWGIQRTLMTMAGD